MKTGLNDAVVLEKLMLRELHDYFDAILLHSFLK